MKRYGVFICLLIHMSVITACEENQIEEGFSVGYEYVVSDEPMPGFVFGIESDKTVFDSGDIVLQIGIGIPESVFLSDEEYKLVLYVENVSTKDSHILKQIEVLSDNQFEFSTTFLDDGVKTIEFTYEDEIILFDEVFNSSDFNEGTLLIGYKVFYSDQNNDEDEHFSTWQRVNYEIEEDIIKLSIINAST